MIWFMTSRGLHVTVLALTLVVGAGERGTSSAGAVGSPDPYELVADSGERIAGEHGTFEVPEHRANKASRTLTLHYVRLPSTASQPRPPMVYLSGGPGASALIAARGPRFPLFNALRRVADVIVFEQRGVGLSNQLPGCPHGSAPPLDRAMDRDATIASLTAQAAECVAFWQSAGVDIRGYKTVESARDLDALRQHLGVPRISLWGISYGTHLALAAYKVMDRQLDRVVLASPDGLDQNIKMPSRGDELFQRLQAMIDKDPDGRSLYPDAAGLINRVLNRLAMQPVRVSATRAGGEPVTFVMGAWEVRLLTAVSLADPSTTVRVLAMYRAADAGDYRAIAQQVYNLLRSGPYLFQGMRELVDAASGVPQDEIPRIEEQARTALLGDLLNFPVLQLRSAFGPLDLGDSFRAPPRSARPTLVLSGTLDGRTFPDDHRRAVRGLRNVTFVTVENGGHNLYEADPRIQELVVAFLRGDAVASQTLSLPPPRFR